MPQSGPRLKSSAWCDDLTLNHRIIVKAIPYDAMAIMSDRILKLLCFIDELQAGQHSIASF
jgi:hypothetical protein